MAPTKLRYNSLDFEDLEVILEDPIVSRLLLCEENLCKEDFHILDNYVSWKKEEAYKSAADPSIPSSGVRKAKKIGEEFENPIESLIIILEHRRRCGFDISYAEKRYLDELVSIDEKLENRRRRLDFDNIHQDDLSRFYDAITYMENTSECLY